MIDSNELIKQVVEWGRSHDLHDPVMQYAKVNEEIGEIAHEITRGNLSSEELKDAIGDSTVTLIILSDILGFDYIDCLMKAYSEIKERKGKTENGSFVKEETNDSVQSTLFVTTPDTDKNCRRSRLFASRGRRNRRH